jgi:hypothetical protein
MNWSYDLPKRYAGRISCSWIRTSGELHGLTRVRGFTGWRPYLLYSRATGWGSAWRQSDLALFCCHRFSKTLRSNLSNWTQGLGVKVHWKVSGKKRRAFIMLCRTFKDQHCYEASRRKAAYLVGLDTTWNKVLGNSGSQEQFRRWCSLLIWDAMARNRQTGLWFPLNMEDLPIPGFTAGRKISPLVEVYELKLQYIDNNWKNSKYILIPKFYVKSQSRPRLITEEWHEVKLKASLKILKPHYRCWCRAWKQYYSIVVSEPNQRCIQILLVGRRRSVFLVQQIPWEISIYVSFVGISVKKMPWGANQSR